MKLFEMLAEFQRKFGHWFSSSGPTLDVPAEVKVLRMRLHSEELGELHIAMHENDLVAIADAIADTLYVVIGTAVTYGIPIDEVLTEVHASNMTKDPGTKAPGDKYAKTGKGASYRAPDIASIVARASREKIMIEKA